MRLHKIEKYEKCSTTKDSLTGTAKYQGVTETTEQTYRHGFRLSLIRSTEVTEENEPKNTVVY
jgi:hypothetical protein